MLQQEKLLKTIMLIFFVNFFLYMFSFLTLNYSIALKGLLSNGSFFNSLVYFNDLFIHIVLVVLKFVSSLFMVGALIALLVIFIFDYLIQPSKEGY